MDALIQLLSAHPVVVTAIVTWFTNNFASAFINALPAPTAQSSEKYKFFWKLSLQLIAGNHERAKNTAVENSPNFQGAIDVQTKLAGVSPIAVQQVPKQ